MLSGECELGRRGKRSHGKFMWWDMANPDLFCRIYFSSSQKLSCVSEEIATLRQRKLPPKTFAISAPPSECSSAIGVLIFIYFFVSRVKMDE